MVFLSNLYQNRPQIIIKSRCKFFQFKHLQENVNISLQIKKIAQTCKYKNLNKSNCTKNKLCLVPFLDHLNRLHSSDEFIIQIRASAKSQNSFHDARPKFIHGLESRRDWNGNCRCPERGFFSWSSKQKKTNTAISILIFVCDRPRMENSAIVSSMEKRLFLWGDQQQKEPNFNKHNENNGRI